MQLIDPTRQAGTLKALKMSFNIEYLNEINLIAGGGSTSKIFKIKIRDKYYVLRLMGLDQPIEDRLIQVECAYYGSRVNVAPVCHYADAVDGIILMDYINHVPFSKEILLDKMPEVLRTLHYTENISKPFCVIFPYMNEFIENIIKITPSSQLINYLKSIQQIMVILGNHRHLASCHNDLNSENVMYNGKQFYLIDFEAAGLEDPYFDLATVCQQNCFDPPDEYNFIKKYLKKLPTKFEINKLMLMKQVSYCYHVLHFFQHAYNAGMMEFKDKVPSFKSWYEGKKTGKYTYDTTPDLMLYGMVVLNQSIQEMTSPKFFQALEMLSL